MASEEHLRTETIHLVGDLDILAAGTVSSRLVVETAAPAVVVDLARVEFMDSSGLRSLLDAMFALEGQSRTLSLVNPSRAVRRVLDVTRTAGRFGLDPE